MLFLEQARGRLLGLRGRSRVRKHHVDDTWSSS